ncbi:hypothetical protein J2Y03_004659 [Neobacillus niacini]|uniref:hypothetical protein n=1 Tax=Neobacillus niacini TaxID=86668 RepID=UPI00285A3E86|nr:hypothetical protein [Neobacillus niacini]MDR7079601.1 hypothetical protein [Neobacillus niacini]
MSSAHREALDKLIKEQQAAASKWLHYAFTCQMQVQQSKPLERNPSFYMNLHMNCIFVVKGRYYRRISALFVYRKSHLMDSILGDNYYIIRVLLCKGFV